MFIHSPMQTWNLSKHFLALAKYIRPWSILQWCLVLFLYDLMNEYHSFFNPMYMNKGIKSVLKVNWKRWKVKTISWTECAMNDTWLCFLWNWLLRRFGHVPSGPLKQHPFLATLFVYLFPSNCNMFPCSVNILAFRGFYVFL